jgi:hypothetical protein
MAVLVHHWDGVDLRRGGQGLRASFPQSSPVRACVRFTSTASHHRDSAHTAQQRAVPVSRLPDPAHHTGFPLSRAPCFPRVRVRVRACGILERMSDTSPHTHHRTRKIVLATVGLMLGCCVCCSLSLRLALGPALAGMAPPPPPGTAHAPPSNP